MAPNAGNGSAAFWDLRGSVVRAAGTEIRGAAKRHDIVAKLAFRCLEKGEALNNARRGMEAGNPLRDDPGDLSWRQLAI